VRDFHTTKLDGGGATIWTHQFNGAGNGNDVVAAGALDGAGNFFVTGTSWGHYVSSGGTAEDIVTFTYLASDNGTPVPQTPAAPSSLTTAATARDRVTLTWQDRSSNETGFSIERCTGTTCANFAVVAQVPAGTTSVVDTGVARKTTYRYRVRAVNGAGASGYSNTATATTPK